MSVAEVCHLHRVHWYQLHSYHRQPSILSCILSNSHRQCGQSSHATELQCIDNRARNDDDRGVLFEFLVQRLEFPQAQDDLAFPLVSHFEGIEIATKSA